jgi:(S)-mandelate dehydrogenase
LALGAKAVMSGRATLYGASAGGQEGAEKALSILGKEFEKVMAYVGCRTVAEVGPDILAMTPAPGGSAAVARASANQAREPAPLSL